MISQLPHCLGTIPLHDLPKVIKEKKPELVINLVLNYSSVPEKVKRIRTVLERENLKLSVPKRQYEYKVNGTRILFVSDAKSDIINGYRDYYLIRWF